MAFTQRTLTAGTPSQDGHEAPRDLALRPAAGGDMHRIASNRVVVLGRGHTADVDLTDASVSRRHALIYNKAPQAQLFDMHSANGTWLGDTRVAPGAGTPIAPGDVIRIGSVVLVVTEAPAEVEPEAPARSPALPHVVTSAPQMRELYELAERVAQSEISVLILGETGTGKEVLAESIHRLSARARGPFVCINCGAFPESLLESELFGHEKGAFTGAVQAKAGLLESADGGTIFLDEVGEMPASLQVKLLRVLEERKITRVGERRPRDVNVRFLAATHRDLQEAVARGTFRQDLYFRINGITLTIPPLRERGGEIADLTRHFLEQAARRGSLSSVPRLSPEALAVLEAHSWPGNIRELRNVIDRALVLSRGNVITAQNLRIDGAPKSAQPSLMTISPPPSSSRMPGPPSSLGIGSEQEKQRILEALERCAGNQTYAARLLGVSRTTLVSRLDLYGIPRPRRGRDEPK